MATEESDTSNLDHAHDHEQGHEPMPEGEEPPPRGVKAAAVVRWALVLGAAVLAAFMWMSFARTHLSGAQTGTAQAAPKYHCPMHPQIVSNDPGECPICHMDLELISGARGSDDSHAAPAAAPAPAPAPSPAAGQDGGTKGASYACPMHPEVTDSQRSRCPICKMYLEPIAKNAEGADGADAAAAPAGMAPAGMAPAGMAPAGMAPTGMAPAGAAPGVTGSGTGTGTGTGVSPGGSLAPGAVPPGTTPLKLALDRIQSIGVRTAVAEDRASTSSLRVTAIVQPPEQGASEVHVRTPGFVESIGVDQTGIQVGAGQTMLSVYSPEIFQAQNELIATSQWAGDAGASTTSSSRRKLELLGMTPKEIEAVVAKREPVRAIAVKAPRGGFVTKKNVVMGSYVTPEMVLYEIQDLSRVYVVADLFLSDIGSVAVGAEGRFVPTGHPERAATAKVDLIYPTVNAEARTRRVRMQIKNDATKPYAPGEYGTVELALGTRRGVAVPRDALVDTGTSTYVFVAEPGGRFAPRVVSIGGADSEHIIIAAGLAAGERVVSGATFLIDSESRLQASIAQAVQTPPAPAASSKP